MSGPQKTHTLSFFQPIVKSKAEAQGVFWKPCGTVYLALAVGICDAIVTSPLITSVLGMNKLIDAYFRRYPLFGDKRKGTPFSDFRAMVLSKETVSQVCKQLADLLYENTLTGLYENVTAYHEFALPQETREYAAHWVAKSAPAVISDRLGLSIRLSTIASGRTWPASTDYVHACKTLIHIRERHGRYSAEITQQPIFEQVLPLRVLTKTDEPFYEKLEVMVHEEIKNTLKTFDAVYQSTLTKIIADQLPKQFLMELFANHMCETRMHGTQAFFDSTHFGDDDHDDDHDVHLMREWAHAYARGVVLHAFERAPIEEAIQQYLDRKHPEKVERDDDVTSTSVVLM